METMNYTCSTSANIDFSLYNSTGGTSVPGEQFYYKKNYSYVPQGLPVLYFINALFEQNIEIMPMTFTDYPDQKDEIFNMYISNALNRYREINNGTIFDISKVNSFLDALRKICNSMQLQPYIIFNNFATKVQLTYNNKDFVIDYDHDDASTVFILSSNNGPLLLKKALWIIWKMY
jgi:hypothetical protein